MSQRRKFPALLGVPERVALADFQRWLNGLKRPPGAERVEYDHRAVRGMLEAYEIELAPLSGDRKGSKLMFRMSDLRRACPDAAEAFEASFRIEPPSDAAAVG